MTIVLFNYVYFAHVFIWNTQRESYISRIAKDFFDK